MIDRIKGPARKDPVLTMTLLGGCCMLGKKRKVIFRPEDREKVMLYFCINLV